VAKRSAVAFLALCIWCVVVAGEQIVVPSVLYIEECGCAVECRFFETDDRPERTLSILDGPPLVMVDGSRQILIQHGKATTPTPCIDGLGLVEICDFIQTHSRFELRIDGELIIPTYIRYTYIPPADGEPSQLGLATVFEFPENHFASSFYTFEGTWRGIDLPCTCGWCAEGVPETEIRSPIMVRTVTVGIYYP